MQASATALAGDRFLVQHLAVGGRPSQSRLPGLSLYYYTTRPPMVPEMGDAVWALPAV